ncbi:MAG: hypothetical protein ACOYN0_08330 [Phycisphaerales bacterium]
MTRPHTRPTTLLLIAAAGSVCLSGCSSATKTPPAKDINNGLIALGSGEVDVGLIPNVLDQPAPSSTEDLFQQAAVDLERVLKAGPRKRSEQPPQPAPSDPNSTGLNALAEGSRKQEVDPFVLAQADDAWTREASASATLGAPTPSRGTDPENPASPKASPSTAPAPATSSDDDRLVALASRIASLLREPARSGAPVITEAVAMATVEAFRPGSLNSVDVPGSTLYSRLSTEDRATLAAARDRVAASPAASSEEIRAALAKIAAPSELRIPQVKLCTKVRGFGQYDAFGSNAFSAGRTSKAIVYTEVEGFTARPARAGDPNTSGGDTADQVSVELEQSLTLFQHDGYQVWHRPPQRVVETSRVKRRDFYLIQIIELHKSLPIGRYNLKVTLKDVASGEVTETTVPLEIVGQ